MRVQRGTSRLASPWKRLGGKANLHRWIISHLPPHESFSEVFGGSAPVLLGKPRPKGLEVYNDLDSLWTNSLAVLRDHGDELAELIAATPYSREEFYRARDILRRQRAQIAPLERARLHMVVLRQSFSADGRTWSTSSFGGENRPKLWAKLPDHMRCHIERLQGVHIEQRDYRYVLDRYDHERSTFYLDPPYLNVDNKYYDANRETGFDHEGLREAVETLKGSIVISYYDSDDVRRLYAGWQIESRDVVVHAGQAKRAETELLIIRKSEYGRRRIKRMQELFDENGNALLP